MNINDYLKAKLIDLQFDISKFKYKTKKHTETIKRYNRLLAKITKIDKVSEKFASFMQKGGD